jgi:iron-sulfur cluster assembly protein
MSETQHNVIALTDKAAAHVRNYLARHGGGNSFRIAVKPTGCSGYQYVIEAAAAAGEDDATFESKGVKIVVDKHSLRYLAGTELDYVREGLNEGFRFNNPNVAETCGCGESFSVADTDA